ncbi:MAG: transposase [Crocinitomicaceae bacterium]|nr:transposase [Crocinitomicaceae bacterium]MDG1777441.1 transposase [Crocinitomicaceae bacterium]
MIVSLKYAKVTMLVLWILPFRGMFGSSRTTFLMLTGILSGSFPRFSERLCKMLNYFENRSTNASAESFNAKIKAFRSQFRGVRNVAFFLFRLTEIYA